MMDDPIDQFSGGGGIGEDAGPLAECQVRSQDKAFSFVAAADDLKEQIGVAAVVGQIADLVDDEQGSCAVVTQFGVETSCGILGAEIEKELGCTKEQDRVPGEDGLIGDILGDHGFAQALRSDEDEVVALAEEVQMESSLDGLAIDLPTGGRSCGPR